MKYNSSPVSACHIILVTEFAVVGAVLVIAHAVSLINTGLHIVSVGNKESALTFQCKRIVVVASAFAASTHIQHKALESQSAAVITLASALFHFESQAVNVTQFQNTNVSQAVQDIAVQEYFQSALHAGSNNIGEFSCSCVIGNVTVHVNVGEAIGANTSILSLTAFLLGAIVVTLSHDVAS